MPRVAGDGSLSAIVHKPGVPDGSFPAAERLSSVYLGGSELTLCYSLRLAGMTVKGTVAPGNQEREALLGEGSVGHVFNRSRALTALESGALEQAMTSDVLPSSRWAWVLVRDSESIPPRSVKRDDQIPVFERVRPNSEYGKTLSAMEWSGSAADDSRNRGGRGRYWNPGCRTKRDEVFQGLLRAWQQKNEGSRNRQNIRARSKNALVPKTTLNEAFLASEIAYFSSLVMLRFLRN